MSQKQLLMLEENSSLVEQREKEIQNVVRSIVDLNTIFKVCQGNLEAARKQVKIRTASGFISVLRLRLPFHSNEGPNSCLKPQLQLK